MYWNRISSMYDLFETAYNGKVYRGTGAYVGSLMKPTDTVLECACGTGAISVDIAPNCRRLMATDFSEGMMKQAAKKLRRFDNVRIRKADIMNIKCRNGRFDKVVAGNVIHLLPDPAGALHELERLVRPGGKIIIPTYINMAKKSAGLMVKALEVCGLHFERDFDLESYKQFFRDMGYENVEYHVVDGRMPCAVAVITKKSFHHKKLEERLEEYDGNITAAEFDYGEPVGKEIL